MLLELKDLIINTDAVTVLALESLPLGTRIFLSSSNDGSGVFSVETSEMQSDVLSKFKKFEEEDS